MQALIANKGKTAPDAPSDGVSVVTVTKNNAKGLAQTLQSLMPLRHPPAEVLVIDSLSDDATGSVIESHRGKLNIRHVRESDQGIYDAMNKGQRLARSAWLHYLNAGDEVW